MLLTNQIAKSYFVSIRIQLFTVTYFTVIQVQTNEGEGIMFYPFRKIYYVENVLAKM